MSEITVSEAALTVRLSRKDKLLGLLGDQVVPRTAITGVEVVPDGLAAVKGIRAPGLGLPGLRMLGTWRGRGRGAKRLVDVRRGQPALRVLLTGQRYDELLLGTDAPEDLAARLSPAR